MIRVPEIPKSSQLVWLKMSCGACEEMGIPWNSLEFPGFLSLCVITADSKAGKIWEFLGIPTTSQVA